MMSPSPQSADTFTVIVVSRNGRTEMFHLAPDATVFELKRLWEARCKLPMGSIMRRADESLLEDDQKMTDIGVAIPGSKTATVSVEVTIAVHVGMYGRKTDDKRTLTVALSTKPEDLHPQVREMFGLGEDRLFRLRTRDRPLNYSLAFADQKLESGATVFVDLGYVIDVTDEWTSAPGERLTFSSEDVGELLTDDRNPQKILLDGAAMDRRSDVFSALPSSYHGKTRVSVTHQHQKDITLMSNGFVKQRLVWPTDVTEQLIQDRPPSKSDLYFEDERLPADTTMKELKLPAHAVVHTVMRVSVKFSDGKRRVLHLPDTVTVADVEEVVSATEETKRFSLTCGGRLLSSSDKIKAVVDGRSIEVERPGETITVYLPDRPVRFTSDRRRIRFTDVMCKVAENGHIELKCLTEKTLEFRGCGRRISQEEEAFQTIPADCCRVRSLLLTMPNPPAMKDAGLQGSWRKRHKKTGVRSSVTESAQQTETAKTRFGASTQHPPPENAPRPFFVFNPDKIGKSWKFGRHGGGKKGFFTQLQLGESPTAGEVRKAIAVKLEVSLDRLELRRWVNLREGDGEKLFAVWDDDNVRMAFADSRGKLCEEAVNRRSEFPSDSDSFFMVPGWKNHVIVFQPIQL